MERDLKKGMNDMDYMDKVLKAAEIKDQIESTQSMTDIYDIVENLDPEITKILLKKYIYASRPQ